MTTATAAIRVLSEEAEALLHEHQSEIVSIDVAPASAGYMKWSVMAVRVVPPSLVLAGGLPALQALHVSDQAKAHLLSLRGGQSLEEACGPARQRQAVIERDRPMRSVTTAGELIRSRTRAENDRIKRELSSLDELLHQRTLKEISELGLLPKGCWRLLGARVRKPHQVRWRKLGIDARGYRYPDSCDHLAIGGTLTFCGTLVPYKTAHQVVWDAPLGKDCLVCLAAARKKGYRLKKAGDKAGDKS